MKRSHFSRLASWLVVATVLGGCSLTFLPPLGQHLDLTFRLAETLRRGEKRPVGNWIVEDGLDTRRRFLQVSGAIVRPANAPLPRAVGLVATVTEPDGGKVRQRLRLTAEITPEDRFRTSKKIRRDIEPGDRVEVTVESSGDDLPAGSEIRLCVDIVRSRRDLRRAASCATGQGPGTFAEIRDRVLTPNCAVAGCHDSATVSAGLDLTPDQAYASLVGVPSSQIFRLLRVAPGKPDDSYLVQKIRGSATINGGRMPLGGPFLSSDQIAGIAEWIENGAANN